ncbi:uncharacterized protein LOC133791656 [Humulus lupulus]|uniref:uncharacterized protein LOC133791656 n=1 Tax=Humulus lupulus TaxID=3486 RepID=UPI002B415A7E|nr:uncharacterized protein LOC133791656 [Humulus lupulus]
MAQQGDPDIRLMFQEGRSNSGPLVKRLRPTSKKMPPPDATVSKSPAKRKGPGSGAPSAAAQEKRGLAAPPPRFPSAPTRDQGAPAGPPALMVPAATVALAHHHSIARAKARNEELKVEIQTTQAALTTTQAALAAAQQGEQSAKTSLTAAQACEQAAKATLTAAQEGEQAAKAASSTLQVELVGAKEK